MKLVKYTHTTFLLKSVKKTILKDTHEVMKTLTL